MADRSFTVTIQGDDLPEEVYARLVLAAWFSTWAAGLGDRTVVHLDQRGTDAAVNRQFDLADEQCPWGP